jgi:hypothetical protein
VQLFHAFLFIAFFAQQLVFGTIQDLLKETMGNEKARETLTRETLGVVRELIGIDPKETAALIQSFVAPGTHSLPLPRPNEFVQSTHGTTHHLLTTATTTTGDDEQITRIHQQVTRLLKPYPRLLYQYLHTLLGPRKQTRGERCSSPAFADFHQVLWRTAKNGASCRVVSCRVVVSVDSAEEQLRRAGQAARRELQEQYLRLMCEYEKGLVLGYLEWLDTSGEIMPPIDFCLRVRRLPLPTLTLTPLSPSPLLLTRAALVVGGWVV